MLRPIALSSALLSLAFAGTCLADGTWETVLSSADPTVPGVANAVWVPNTFNNPTIDNDGRVQVRGQVGGAGITLANSRLIVRGVPGNWTILARDGSPVPSNDPAGFVFNNASGQNGLGSANIITSAGDTVVAGTINGPGVTTTTDTAMYFVPGNGAASWLMAREGMAYPTGATITSTFTGSSGMQCNTNGEAVASVSLSGGDVSGSTNNQAIVVFSSTGVRPVFRKGSAAPGFADGTTLTPDTFGLQLNGSGDVAFGGTLVGGTVTTADDKVLVTTAGAPAGQTRIVAREGTLVQGYTDVAFKSTGSFSPANHALAADGSYLFTASFEGAGVATGINDGGVILEKNGIMTMLLRRGDTVPNTGGLVFFGVSNTAFLMNSSGAVAYQGILMNADGSQATNTGYIGVRKADGTVITVLREGDTLPGGSATISSVSGQSNLCFSDCGVAVFTASLSDTGSAVIAWDEVHGLRTLGRTGDTTFTGTPAEQITLIGSTGVNGNSGNTGISSTGWLVLRAADFTNQVYAVSRIFLGSNPCPSDLNGDQVVDGADLGLLLGNWGNSGVGDIDGSGTVDGADLGLLLGGWGACP
ncbi:MAG: choice-of-anchor tandem repeat NxxGxxAF-containing protein [Phycisphaerales bacterium]